MGDPERDQPSHEPELGDLPDAPRAEVDEEQVQGGGFYPDPNKVPTWTGYVPIPAPKVP